MILDPDQRTNFLDLLRPPTGYRLDGAVGTAYSMDLVALTAVLLAFVDAEADSDSEQLNQVEVLRAITRLAGCVRVFVDRSHLTPGEAGTHGKLSSLFDRIVREVTFKEGCFHPKVWVARYQPKASAEAQGQKPLVRIVCASRNLTTSPSWEIFAAFEGQEDGGRPGKGLTRDIAAFLEQLHRSAGRGEDLLRRLQAALLRAQIDPPRHMEAGCRFNWQWHGGPALWNSFPERGTRALIVSPFVRANFLSRIVSGFPRITLVSTQNELDALGDEFYRKLAVGNDLFVVRSAEAEDGSAAMQLHAKLFICETLTARTVLLGSANASDSAWKSRNCEAVVAFSPGMSIDQFYQSFIYSPKPTAGEQAALRGWIERYERRPVINDEASRVEKQLDQLQKMLAALPFYASYDVPNQVLRVTCPDLAAKQELVALLAQYRLRLCPLSRFERESDLMDSTGLLTDGLAFTAFRVLDLTDFLVLEIAHPSAAPKRFIVLAKTNLGALREERDAAILNEFLTVESFRLFLRAILFDGVSRGNPSAPGADSRHGKGDGTGWTLLGDTTLEDVMQSCTEDSSRIGEINQLLQVFKRTKAADDEFKQFLEFWNVFQSAHAEAQGPPHA